jgi:isopenicillin N synthase-like dioxygenase
MIAELPVINPADWTSGDGSARARLADEVDQAARHFGFLLLENHGIDPSLAAAARALAGQFFALPEQVKYRYATGVGGSGWMPPGLESNSYALGVPAPPDLKESFMIFENGRPGVADETIVTELPGFNATLHAYFEASWLVAEDLYDLFAAALRLPPGALRLQTSRRSSALKVNLYPPLSLTGPPQPGQFRVGAHSDFGVVTLLDRQPGYGGLQIQLLDGTWVDAPYVEGTLTINIGDLLARWTGDRWRSTVHRVLPPSDQAPDESLISLIHFCGVEDDAIIKTLPVGGPTQYETIVAGDYVGAKMASINVA